jgi:hypothetical protein
MLNVAANNKARGKNMTGTIKMIVRKFGKPLQSHGRFPAL